MQHSGDSVGTGSVWDNGGVSAEQEGSHRGTLKA